MKKIAILTALNAEGKQFEEVFGKSLKTDLYGHFVIKTYQYNGNEVYLAKSGVGEILASACTALLINIYKAEVIINFGLAGGYKSHKKGDCMIISDVVHYDFDTSAIDDCKPATYIDLFDSQFIKTDTELFELAKTVDNGLIEALLASGDKFIEEGEFKESLYKTYGATVYDMEAAAVLIISRTFNVPCLIIKVISDNGSSADYYDFKDLLRDTKTKFIDLVAKIIEKL